MDRFCFRTLSCAGLAWTLAALVGFAQERPFLGPPATPLPTLPAAPQPAAPSPPLTTEDSSPLAGLFDFGRGSSGFLRGTHDFDRFIGFIGNPVQNIDPRAVTEIYPIFGSSWASGNGPLLAEANAQVYGAGLTVALSDRLSFGLNQGGFAVLDINSARQGQLAKLHLPIPQRDLAGQREGWMNLGGFFQYTLIADAQRQFLLTAGLRWEAPSGAEQVFQGGANPAYLAPYLTAGKEIGNWHILATTGYEFPTGAGQVTTDTAYLNLHIDRRFGWFYPLIEFNGSYHTNTVNLNLPPRVGVLDLGTFESSGNLLTMAAGANAVIVPGKLEVGAVYIRPLASQYNFDFNGMLVRMTYRY